MGEGKTIWMNAAAGAASQAGGIGLGMGMQRIGVNYDHRKQRKQQEKLMEIQMRGERQMMDYQQLKQLEMWEKTGYGAQMKQMKEAGLNPALMYGMGGGGGQSVGGTMPSVGGGTASDPNTRGAGGATGMGIMATAMQMSLLKAQKENIEADTKSKLADVPLKDQQQDAIGLDNAMKRYLRQTDMEGNDTETIKGSIAEGQHKSDIEKTRAETRFKLDENERQKLMNSAVMNEIGAKIDLMKKQGLTQENIYKNLHKEGLILDAEIEWNKLDIEKGNVGKFITNIIKMLFKPR